MVTLRSQCQEKQPDQVRRITARLQIESHIPFQELANADGATWWDRKLLSKNPLEFRNKGFGAEATRALRLRQQWLVREELMSEQGGQLVARRTLLETLERREVTRVAKKFQRELGLSYQPIGQGSGYEVKSANTSNWLQGVLPLCKKGKSFRLFLGSRQSN